MLALGEPRLDPTMNHETQRLLFAAGRGARFQTTYGGGFWRDTACMFTSSPELHRIYHEDVHLQYGPVSAELRRRADAEHHTSALTPYAWMADTWVRYCAGAGAITFGKSGNYLWLCAFAAELAADEGT